MVVPASVELIYLDAILQSVVVGFAGVPESVRSYTAVVPLENFLVLIEVMQTNPVRVVLLSSVFLEDFVDVIGLAV